MTTLKRGVPTLKIKGKQLKGGEIYIAGNISSQFISAILMVAPHMEEGLLMHIEKEVVSRPYIDLTMNMMAKCGVNIKWHNNDITVKPQKFRPIKHEVEADWTAASYWYEMVAMLPGSEVHLKGLEKSSLQGDSNITSLFTELGVSTRFVNDGIMIRNVKRKAKKFFHDFTKEPDLAQTLAATCCFLQSLKIKETDRVHALINELKKLGFVLRENEIGMLEWNGERCTPEEDPVIDTYDDHRMAMSMAPGAIAFGSLRMNDPHVVSKSYPNFWDDLQQAGFNIEE